MMTLALDPDLEAAAAEAADSSTAWKTGEGVTGAEYLFPRGGKILRAFPENTIGRISSLLKCRVDILQSVDVDVHS